SNAAVLSNSFFLMRNVPLSLIDWSVPPRLRRPETNRRDGSQFRCALDLVRRIMTRSSIDELQFILPCGNTVCGGCSEQIGGTHSKQIAVLLAPVASIREELSLQPDQRPVERNQEYQHCELDERQPGTHAHQITRGEIAVGVTDDQHAGL